MSNGKEMKSLNGYEIVDNHSREQIEQHIKDTIVHVTKEEKDAWNAGSNFSGSYNDLMDKPFGIEGEIFIDGDITTTVDEEDGSIYWVGSKYNKNYPFEEMIGDNFVVAFDGVEYLCTLEKLIDTVDLYTLGNSAILGGDEEGYEDLNTGEPFLIGLMNLGEEYSSCVIYTREVGTYSIKVETEDVKIHTIDTMFIPDTIARVSDINDLIINTGGSGKELIGEFTLNNTNLIKSSTAGIYNLGSDVQAIMRSAFAKLDEGFDELIGEITMGDVVFYAQCHYCGGSNTLNVAQNIQCVLSGMAHQSKVTLYEFLEGYLRTNETTYMDYAASGSLPINVKLYKVTSGAGQGGSIGGSGKTLVGELTLNNTNLTASDTDCKYNLGTDLQTISANIYTELDKGFGALFVEVTMADIVYTVPASYNNGGSNSFKGISCVGTANALTGAMNIIELGENVLRVNSSCKSWFDYVVSGALTINIKVYTVSGGTGGSGGSGNGAQSDYNQNDSTAADYIKNKPFYSITETLYDGEIKDRENSSLCSLSGIALLKDINETFDVTYDGVKYSSLKPQYIKTFDWVTPELHLGNLYIWLKVNAEQVYKKTIEELLQTTPEFEVYNVDTGEPFCLVTYDDNSGTEVIVDDSEVSVHNMVVEKVIEFKQIDEKYIPSSIARVSDIPRKQELINDILNALPVWQGGAF